MTQGVLPGESLAGLAPEKVSPGLVALVGDDAPTRTILLAGAGSFECAHVTMTQGVFIGDVPDAAQQVAARWSEIRSRAAETVPRSGWEQYKLELAKAGLATELAGAD